MYKKKSSFACEMPACKTPAGGNGKEFSVLVLNASLKHGEEISKTGELAQLVVGEMKKLRAGGFSAETSRAIWFITPSY